MKSKKKKNKKQKNTSLSYPQISVQPHTAYMEYILSEGWDNTCFFTAFHFQVKSQEDYSCTETHLSGPWLRRISNQLKLKKKTLEKKGKP